MQDGLLSASIKSSCDDEANIICVALDFSAIVIGCGSGVESDS